LLIEAAMAQKKIMIALRTRNPFLIFTTVGLLKECLPVALSKPGAAAVFPSHQVQMHSLALLHPTCSIHLAFL